MLFELEEIKKIRKRLGITQFELAKKAQVSQSLIAKIESKRIDPTFTKVKKIFDVLQELSNKNELKAEYIMTKRVIYVNADDNITSATNKMKKHEISQLPVFSKKNVVGLVSESTILDSISSNKPDKIKTLMIKDIMQDCPPIVSKKTSTSIISDLLKHYPIILVAEDGKPTGVITKSDMLRTLYKG